MNSKNTAERLPPFHIPCPIPPFPLSPTLPTTNQPTKNVPTAAPPARYMTGGSAQRRHGKRQLGPALLNFSPVTLYVVDLVLRLRLAKVPTLVTVLKVNFACHAEGSGSQLQVLDYSTTWVGPPGYYSKLP